MDDPLSALDHPTAENIVQSCFAPQSNLAKGRTIILVTHRTGLVRHLATQFIEITDGRVSVLTHDPFPDDDPTQQNESSNSKSVDTQPSPTPEKKAQATKVPRDFIKEEQREHGSIKLNVFLTFSNAARAWWIFLFGMLALVRVSAIAEQWMFKAWGEGYGEVTTTSSIVYQPEFQSKRKEGMVKLYFSLDPAAYLPSPNDDLRPWIIVLLAVSIGRCIALCLYAISQYTAIYATTSVFFEQALKRVTNATFQFYDNTPAGRILNRVTSDIDILDSALDSFGGTLSSIGIFVSALIVIASISPIFFLFVGTLMAIFVLIFRKFLPTSRSLKRLEATALSPLYTIFGELLQNNSAGLTTVRAFRAQPHFYNRVVSIIDQFQAYNHFYFSVQNWLMWRYENISNLSSFLLTMIALATDLSPGMMAFLLLTAGNFVNATHLVCSRFGSMQTEFVAVERIAELLETEQEPKGDYNPPASWPRIGSNVTLKNVTIKYSSDLEPALHNISLSIPGGRYVPTPITPLMYSVLTHSQHHRHYRPHWQRQIHPSRRPPQHRHPRTRRHHHHRRRLTDRHERGDAPPARDIRAAGPGPVPGHHTAEPRPAGDVQRRRVRRHPGPRRQLHHVVGGFGGGGVAELDARHGGRDGGAEFLAGTEAGYWAGAGDLETESGGCYG